MGTGDLLTDLVGKLETGQIDRRRFLQAASLLGVSGAAAAFLAACAAPTASPSIAPSVGAPPSGAASGSPAASAGPKLGGVLRSAGETQIPPSFDPHTEDAAVGGAETTLSQIYDGLLEVGPDASFQPALAESWEISPDSKVFTFKIRKGVKFHNGRELTPDDVVYSFDRIRDPNQNHPYRSQYELIQKIEATDASTVVMTLDRPYSPFLIRLNHVGASIVPKEEVEKGGFGLKPIGTGPFKYNSHALDDFLDLEANRDFWRPGLPYLDGLYLKANPDKQAAVLAVRAGEYDMFRDAPAEIYEELKADSKFSTFTGDDYTFSWFQMNAAKVPAFGDERVIQAINWALNRDEIAELTWPSLSTPLRGGLLPPSHWAALKEDVYPQQDQAKAKQLLADAGFADGFEFTLNTRSDAGSGQFPRLAEVFKQQLAAVGIKVNIVVDPPGVKRMLTFGPENDSMMQGTPATPEPDDTFHIHYIKGGERNITNWEDPKVTDLITQAQQTSDQATRAGLYQEAQKIVAGIGPLVVMFIAAKYDFSQSFVKGHEFNATSQNWRSSRQVWLDK